MNDLRMVLEQLPGAVGRIAHIEVLPARMAQYADPAQPLPTALAAALTARGISQLYAHQAAAVDAARRGEHVGVVTATASGKTLCYQLPTLEVLLDDPKARALLLFPTKALAHDQLRSIERLIVGLPASVPQPAVAAYDGDTPRHQRDHVRLHTQLLLSNPDMLHRSVLPEHRRWAAWLEHLRFVVIDEAHLYRGVFGTHVALILRRLRRLCAFYGASPQFVLCSATSANPDDHLSALCGAPVTVISADGAPQGPRTFVFWNPPVIDEGRKISSPTTPAWVSNRLSSAERALTPYDRLLIAAGLREPLPAAPAAESQKRRSTNVETAGVLVALVRSGVKTLAFARTRRAAELILRYAREQGDNQGHTIGSRIAAYRAGYDARQRRELEQAFVSDQLTGLVSTNALELGVDIGGVDAVVIGGYPGSVASTWQQAGRAGRSQAASLAVLVAQDDPLDQFYMRHPQTFFARPHEQARVALHNPYILSDQLCCAAAELPLVERDLHWFGETMPALCHWLLRQGRLVDGDSGMRAVGRPAADVNIRSADGSPVLLRDAETGRVIEQSPASRAPFELYPGAIYLHQGETYQVEQLNQQEALARRCEVRFYTQTRDTTDIAIERVLDQRVVGPAALCLGVVRVTRQVTGYRRKEHYTDTVLSEHDLSLPPQTFRTQAVWWTIPDSLAQQISRVCGDLPGALHAMEHAAIGLLPLFAQCDRADIGGVSTAFHPETQRASVFVYDGVPGGVGIAATGYEQAEAWWAATHDLLRDCPCVDGCPACVQSPKCGSGNQPLSKAGARQLAAYLLGL